MPALHKHNPSSVTLYTSQSGFVWSHNITIKRNNLFEEYRHNNYIVLFNICFCGLVLYDFVYTTIFKYCIVLFYFLWDLVFNHSFLECDIGFCWIVVAFCKLHFRNVTTMRHNNSLLLLSCIIVSFSSSLSYLAMGGQAAEYAGHPRLHVEVSSYLALP